MTETPQQTAQARIEVTDKAVEELKKALDGRDLSSVGLKVTVHPGGCSGFQYGLGFEEAPEGSDVEIQTKGVRLFLDANTAPLLDGITIDYIDSLMGGGFKIENPNASSTCGCGKSFS
ncbi:MAG: iron-sulfur cluster assembly accessory protein [Euryarchaeota archaeon]|nr:iron-sulfur cluster assembly accessory protein [Euryarchaeota archaeon]